MQAADHEVGMARERAMLRIILPLRRKNMNGLFCKDCQIK